MIEFHYHSHDWWLWYLCEKSKKGERCYERSVNAQASPASMQTTAIQSLLFNWFSFLKISSSLTWAWSLWDMGLSKATLFPIAHRIRKVWLTVKPQLKQPGISLLYFRIQTASAASCHLCHNSEKRPVIWSDISIIHNSNSHNFLNKGKFMTTVLSNEQRLE